MQHRSIFFNSVPPLKKLFPIFCVLTVCLVMLYGCADPSAPKKNEAADDTAATQKIKSVCLWTRCV